MKLEDKVCSLELSKKLDALGWKIEAEFVWIWDAVKQAFVLRVDKDVSNKGTGKMLYGCLTCFPAPLACELAEVLPGMCSSMRLKDDYGCFDGEQWGGKWVCINPSKIEFVEDTQADALAKMVIRLTENKLITPEANNAEEEN